MFTILNQQLVSWTKSEEAAVQRLQATLARASGMRREPDRPWQDDDRTLLQATCRLTLLRCCQRYLVAPLND